MLDTARAAAADLNLPVVRCPTVASSDAAYSVASIAYTYDGFFLERRIFRRNHDLSLRVPSHCLESGPPAGGQNG
jgi:glycerol dehydrogenase